MKVIELPAKDGVFKPIHFPGGDPLAKCVAPEPPKAAAEPKVKRKPPPQNDAVLGLAAMPDNTAERVTPGRVIVFGQPGAVRVASGPVRMAKPGPVQLANSTAAPMSASEAMSMPSVPVFPPLPPQTALRERLQSAPAVPVFPPVSAPVAASATTLPGPADVSGIASMLADGSLSASVLPTGAAAHSLVGDFICKVCMRKFNSEDTLKRHELMSDLHKKNLAALQAVT